MQAKKTIGWKKVALVGTYLLAASTILVAIAGVLYAVYMGLVYLGVGATIPAQVQITVNRNGVKHEEFVIALDEITKNADFSVASKGDNGRYARYFNNSQHVELSTSYPAPNLDLAYSRFEVIDRRNRNGAISFAADIAKALPTRFPVTRVYVQLDPSQYQCEERSCAFEMSTPIDPSVVPKWRQSK